MPHVQIYDHTASHDQFRGPQAWEPNTTGEGGIVYKVYTESMTLKGEKLGGVGGRRVGNSTVPPLVLQNLDDIAKLDIVVEC